MLRPLATLFAAIALMSGHGATAQQSQNGFDLDGPRLSITVTRGGTSLPISAVPALRAGDRISVRALLPDDQASRYILVGAFLRGATNPPPKKWFADAETWRSNENVLELTVPDGAEQALLFMAPQAGGGFDTVRDAVRGRPGVFVRAAQDLYQASLDQGRLDTFINTVDRIAETQPERLGAAAPVLAKSLGIKLNAECLSRPRALQASCLTQNREALVLQAQRGTTLAETLTGTPVDLAYRIAATPEAGGGYYSPYIGLARDVARLFGAFRTAQYQYLPALTVGAGDEMRLKLNAAPSFQNPRSVLVAPLPPIGVAAPPHWQSASPAQVCLARPGATIPLDDAALLFATGYARDLTLAVTADGKVSELPVIADAQAGGVRLASRDQLDSLGTVTGGLLRGKWGFDAFSGPRVPVVLDTPAAWQPDPDDGVVVGRTHNATLRGGAAACAAQLTLTDSAGTHRPVEWKATGPDAIEAKLPLERTRPGAVTLTVARYGAAAPQPITLTGRVEASRLQGFTVHAGDRHGTLLGTRLDQVRYLTLGAHRFSAGDVTRGPDGDRMTMLAETPVNDLEPGRGEGTATLRDGRTAKVAVTIAALRPAATIINRQATFTPVEGTLPITLPDALLPAQGRLDFSFRVTGVLKDGIEIAAQDGATARLDFTSGALQRVGTDVVVASIQPQQQFGRSLSGPLRFRLLNGDAPGDWQPLAHIVRLPEITDIACNGQLGCRLTGRGLFLIAAISTTADFAAPVAVPIGFVGASVDLPPNTGQALYLKLHDAPDAVVQVTRR